MKLSGFLFRSSPGCIRASTQPCSMRSSDVYRLRSSSTQLKFKLHFLACVQRRDPMLSIPILNRLLRDQNIFLPIRPRDIAILFFTLYHATVPLNFRSIGALFVEFLISLDSFRLIRDRFPTFRKNPWKLLFQDYENKYFLGPRLQRRLVTLAGLFL